MKRKGWAIFCVTDKGLRRVPFDPNGWQNKHGNHISKKAATMATNGLMERMPDDTEFVILEVFGRDEAAAGAGEKNV